MQIRVPLAWLYVAAQVAATSSSGCGVVDLGYTRHEGSQHSSGSFQYCKFTDVRYAAPPLGQYRFMPPVAPKQNRTVQTAGEHKVQCLQATPGWFQLVDRPIDNSTHLPLVTAADIPPAEPGESEDCLFLDVLVTESVLASNNSKAAVLVNIHGGGFVVGSKSTFGYGNGLVEAASSNGIDLIYVSVNYRLGLLGFLAAAERDGIPANLGLLDQRFALQWVQKYIHLFGGDASSVTVMGNSAGGGSILYQIASQEVDWKSLFSRAIPQSPFVAYQAKSQQAHTLGRVLRAANVSSASSLKHLSSEELRVTNGVVVGNTRPYGTYTFAPVGDADFAGFPPRQISQWLGEGNVPMMPGHNSDEGIIFASPFVHSSTGYKDYLTELFPALHAEDLKTLAEELYPADFSGRYGYTDELGRVSQTFGDAFIVCSAYGLNLGAQRNGESFAYQFSEPPGYHADDLAYTYFDRPESQQHVNATLANIFQTYMTNFAAKGDPYVKCSDCAPRLPLFPPAHSLTLQNLNSTRLGPLQKDSMYEKRCEWWLKGLFEG